MTMPDYYKILQVDPEAEDEVIEAAYRRLARKYHPDVYSGPEAAERMRELNLAYGVLNSPAKRQDYDARREEEFAAQVQRVAERITGGQRAVTRADLERHAGQARRRREAPAGEAANQEEQRAARPAEVRPGRNAVTGGAQGVKTTTGGWAAVRPTASPTGSTPTVIYRRPFSDTLVEEVLNLAEGLLAIGLLGYPILTALCWLPLHALWAHLGFSGQTALLASLGAPLLPILVLSWWFGRYIRHRR